MSKNQFSDLVNPLSCATFLPDTGLSGNKSWIVLIPQNCLSSLLFWQLKGLKKDLGEYEVLRNIVSDADKLEAIGEAGMLRSYQYETEVHPDSSTEQVTSRGLPHTKVFFCISNPVV